MLLERKVAGHRRTGARKDVGYLLIEQIESLAGPGCSVTLVRERPWASITFSGTRHYILIREQGREGRRLSDDFATNLAAHDFDLPGHFVADMLIDDSGAGELMTVEILTIMDPLVREPLAV